MRVLGALGILCIFVGLMSSVAVHQANAQAEEAATSGTEHPTEGGSQQASKLGAPPTPTPGPPSRMGATPFVIALVLLAIVAGVLLWSAGRLPGRSDPYITRLGPSFFFWLGMTYVALLLLAALAYSFSSLPQPYLIGGLLPIAVPWFGALGAVTISLEGVFLWNSTWDSKYNYWHIGRPLFGAVLGIVAFFLFVVIGTASGTAPRFLDAAAATGNVGEHLNAKDMIIFYVLAFLVGYREETFRDLIKRATDLILKPGTQTAEEPQVTFRVNGVAVSEIVLPAVTGAGTSSVEVGVQNSGKMPLVAPAVAISVVAPVPADTFAANNDKVTGAGDLAPGQVRTLNVTFKPPAVGSFAGTLRVSAANLTTPRAIRISGKRET